MIVLAVAGVGVLVVLVSWFAGLQRQGRDNTVFGVLVTVVLVEALLNSAASAVEEGGIFRPVVAGQDFRAPDLVIVAGVGALALTGGQRRDRKLSMCAVLWSAFVLWYATAAYVGLANGNPTSEVLFHGKALFYLSGGAILASQVQLGALLDAARFRRWRTVLAVTSAVFVVGTLVGLAIRINVPGVEIARAGTLSNDAITIVVGLGVIILLGILATGERPGLAGVAAVLMVAAPLAGAQRANFVGGAASLGVVVIAMFGSTFRARVKVTGTQMWVFLSGMLLVGLLGTVMGGAKVDILAKFDETFFNGVESQTAAVREEAWSQARDLIAERPLAGWGLGIEQTIGPVGAEQWRNARDEAREISSHNLMIDLALRSGVIGLALGLGGLLMTARDAVITWRRHRRGDVAALGLGLAALIAGIVAKGMVESVFEKFRLVVMLGMAIGLLRAAAREALADEDADERWTQPISRRSTWDVKPGF